MSEWRRRGARGGAGAVARAALASAMAVGVLAPRPAAAQVVPQAATGEARERGGEGGDTFFAPMRWRNIGPNRGGRSIAVAGSSARVGEYYFGATGGGVWKTTDGGTTWEPVSDGQLGSSSVGAIAVAESNPDVVYVGMGETELRGNVMQGDGVYRSSDAGRSWRHAGLAATRAIARVRVHPTDANLVYVAALGDPYAPNEERGVFRSADGGASWKRILYRGDRAGAADLVIDPSDPRVLYATLWEVYRRPWQLWSGGSGSALFKSVDGGDTWTELTRNAGLPDGVLGKITVTVSPADARRVWANVEAADGGLYRSDDAGATWSLVNGGRDLWQRAFYFMRLAADPTDRETVYVMNFFLEKSVDGGKSFRRVDALHVDHHDMWIDPRDPRRMVEANDGGASVSMNGGITWTGQRYPTAQMYRVATTDDFPYHVCGAQQDNTTACVPSVAGHLAPPDARPGDWYYEVGGGESADIAPKPGAPDIFFAGSTNTLTRYDRRTGQVRDVQPNPRIVMGEPASAMPERWNWTYPIATSRVNPRLLFAGSQHLWRSSDDGATWRRISPDLTRADSATMGNSGGAIILDQDGPEVYATIFTIAPSRRDTATIWTGSDDGVVHVTRDGGTTWRDVTPKELPPNTRVSRIDASWHRAGRAYVAAERHQLGDRSPYIWKTDDFGATWTRIVTGLAPGDFVRVVREDRVREGLLYAGTEHGVRVSFDDGAHWRSLSLNLPDLQVADLVVEERDLVIATHGRSFWLLEDLSALRQATAELLAAPATADARLFRPATAVRRVYAANIDFHLPRDADSVSIAILDAEGKVVRTLGDLPRQAGTHRVGWDLTYPGATSFSGIVLEGGDPRRGVWAPPGRYQVRLSARLSGRVFTESQPLLVRRDPRLVGVADADLRAQFDLARQVRDRESEANEAVLRIRDVRARLAARIAVDTPRLGASAAARVRGAAERFLHSVSAVEGELYQVRNQSPKDKIAFPIRLNDRLTGLRAHIETGDAAPTAAQRRVFRELQGELTRHLTRLESALRDDLAPLNAALAAAGLAPFAATPPPLP